MIMVWQPSYLYPRQLEEGQKLGAAAGGQPPGEWLQELLVGPELLQLLAEVQDAGGEARRPGHQALHLAPGDLAHKSDEK